MEADDLLCSRNARSRTPLVGRAQWKINQPPSLRDNERAWRSLDAQSRIDQATLENEIVEGITHAEEGRSGAARRSSCSQNADDQNDGKGTHVGPVIQELQAWMEHHMNVFLTRAPVPSET